MAKIPPEHVGRQQNPIAIRQAKDGDLNEIIRLVQEVVAETSWGFEMINMIKYFDKNV